MLMKTDFKVNYITHTHTHTQKCKTKTLLTQFSPHELKQKPISQKFMTILNSVLKAFR